MNKFLLLNILVLSLILTGCAPKIYNIGSLDKSEMSKFPLTMVASKDITCGNGKKVGGVKFIIKEGTVFGALDVSAQKYNYAYNTGTLSKDTVFLKFDTIKYDGGFLVNPDGNLILKDDPLWFHNTNTSTWHVMPWMDCEFKSDPPFRAVKN